LRFAFYSKLTSIAPHKYVFLAKFPDGVALRNPGVAAKYPFGVIAREGGRSSIPETAVIEPMGHGVLGRPVKPGDDIEKTMGCILAA
jgi:hypothetical protein